MLGCLASCPPRPSATFKELFKRAPSVRLPLRIFLREIDGDGVRAGMPFGRFFPSFARLSFLSGTELIRESEAAARVDECGLAWQSSARVA